MDVERTMEFILEQQAKNQAMLAEWIAENRERDAVIDRRLDRLERTVATLARLGVRSRTKINNRLDQHERWFAEFNAGMDRVRETLIEVGDKLNGLIDVVDRWPHTPSQS